MSSGLGRSFRRVWLSTASSNLADGVIIVGFPLLAIQLTRSPLHVSLLTALATLPWLAVSLHAGALADRRDRRRIVISATAVRVALMAGLVVAALVGQITLPVLYLAALLFGIAEVFADTTTQAMLPTVVPIERLGAANGRIIATQTIANNFLGGPLGSLLVGVSAVAFFAAPALLYGLAAAVMWSLRGDFRTPRREPTTISADIREGLVYLRGHRVVFALALLAGAMNLASSAYLAVFVLWVVGPESAIGLAPEAYGAVMAAFAAGGVIGAVLTERLTARLGEVGILLGSAALSGLLLLVPVWIPSPWALAPAAILIGVTATMTNVTIVSLRQRLIRPELLGRVNAAYRLIGSGAMPIGALVGGVLGALFGLVVVFHGAAALTVGAAVWTLRRVNTPSIAGAELHASRTSGEPI